MAMRLELVEQGLGLLFLQNDSMRGIIKSLKCRIKYLEGQNNSMPNLVTLALLEVILWPIEISIGRSIESMCCRDSQCNVKVSVFSYNFWRVWATELSLVSNQRFLQVTSRSQVGFRQFSFDEITACKWSKVAAAKERPPPFLHEYLW